MGAPLRLTVVLTFGVTLVVTLGVTLGVTLLLANECAPAQVSRIDIPDSKYSDACYLPDGSKNGRRPI